MDQETERNTMMEFWKEHSKLATVEEMMLDSNAQELTQHELPEILSMLPSLAGSDVLELGAGIGRYTRHLIGKARHVTAVDFMEKFVEKNREENGHLGNAEFIQADVTKLDFPKHSFDLVFSNWLLMYLSDQELKSLVEKFLKWLRPGGYLFFRESCFHQSGDSKRDFNPTHYRTPAHYNHLMSSVLLEESEKTEKKCHGFDMVLNKTVQTYVKMKKNQNQLCWLMQKACRGAVDQHQGGFSTFQQFLDNQQYTRRGILRYEKMFGSGFVSTGGLSTTKEFVDMLNLTAKQKVLDVGCGIGGGDFYMAKTFGVEVLGMDLSSNMVEIAMERAVTEKLPLVQFEVSDATKRRFPDATFDVVYSRDTILHIRDKLDLFRKFYSWMKPGGKLLISDYCCGEKPWTPAFQDYVNQRGYILYTPQRYGRFLSEVGFSNVRVEDRTEQFIQVIKTELQRAEDMKEEFIQEFSKDDYDVIVKGWTEKLQRCETGDQRWGLFYATKE
ncbi:phosphoethanolamine methyltransferase isoform X2 [Pimephales promelas]|uniref:phosphoethanolamine methyltransferase isoform X2 n=1 Tax=Pimephales promelas TaxID=90988 RepID=UPI001955EEF8|nr:phosphoethanolamine methyltransferase isoform X2 [Pimephales promelas]KAG1934554.1 S-adenosyl-L-methionine-dependent methyltransferases superfamily protein [Pimephales promelas]